MRSLLTVLLLYSSIPVYAKDLLLIVGDSLSAGYGISAEQGWVTLLERRLQQDDYDYQVINASVSGATTADGLRELPRLLQQYSPAIVMLALGSNDGLRGQPVFVIKNNLSKMIKAAKDSRAKVLLAGFQLPFNYGEKYRQQFADIFPDLSRQYKTELVPFLLAGFADDLNYFQADKLHPTARAQPLILDNVWPHLQTLLE